MWSPWLRHLPALPHPSPRSRVLGGNRERTHSHESPGEGQSPRQGQSPGQPSRPPLLSPPLPRGARVPWPPPCSSPSPRGRSGGTWGLLAGRGRDPEPPLPRSTCMPGAPGSTPVSSTASSTPRPSKSGKRARKAAAPVSFLGRSPWNGNGSSAAAAMAHRPGRGAGDGGAGGTGGERPRERCACAVQTYRLAGTRTPSRPAARAAPTLKLTNRTPRWAGPSVEAANHGRDVPHAPGPWRPRTAAAGAEGTFPLRSLRAGALWPPGGRSRAASSGRARGSVGPPNRKQKHGIT